MGLALGEGLLAETFAQLRSCGRGGNECVVYWSGPRECPELVDKLLHPDHASGPGHYEVDPAWVTRTWIELARERRAIRAQIHSHPASAFHSGRDDAFPLVRTTGFLSLVVPSFAEGEASLRGTFLGELGGDGSWRELDPQKHLRPEGE